MEKNSKYETRQVGRNKSGQDHDVEICLQAATESLCSQQGLRVHPAPKYPRVPSKEGKGACGETVIPLMTESVPEFPASVQIPK